MKRSTALEAANILYNIENTEFAIEELERPCFQELSDEVFTQIAEALNARLAMLNAQLEEVKDV